MSTPPTDLFAVLFQALNVVTCVTHFKLGHERILALPFPFFDIHKSVAVFVKFKVCWEETPLSTGEDGGCMLLRNVGINCFVSRHGLTLYDGEW